MIDLEKLEKGQEFNYKEIPKLLKMFGVGFFKRWISNGWTMQVSKDFTKDEIAKLLFDSKLVQSLEEAIQKTEILIGKHSLGPYGVEGYHFVKSNGDKYQIRSFSYLS